MSISGTITVTANDLRYILAYRTFADVWLALSLDIRLNLKHVAEAGTRIFTQPQQKFSARGDWIEEPIDLVWARKLCKAYNIRLKGSINLRPSLISTKEPPSQQPTEEEISEFQRFLTDFLTESRDGYAIGLRGYHDTHMQRFGIEKALVTTKNFLLVDTYYPRKFGLLETFNPRHHIHCFRFILKSVLQNPFIRDRKPPFFNVLKELNPSYYIEALPVEGDQSAEPHGLSGQVYEEHPQDSSMRQKRTRVAEEIITFTGIMQPNLIIPCNVSESPQSRQSIDPYKAHLEKGAAGRIQKRAPSSHKNIIGIKGRPRPSLLSRGIRSKLSMVATPRDQYSPP
ncbi:hypothetical protein TWF788_008262 [Orbilia oligospora]|uniref:Uncharacterized protein n=1 Tax=Orbilia oligospora TaxID=2813651 RepID=A0A7C8Q3P2_ORBOL|nr:hypothetical protein TWF788_008262 [Orbilia oligospora]